MYFLPKTKYGVQIDILLCMFICIYSTIWDDYFKVVFLFCNRAYGYYEEVFSQNNLS